jgi:hypothetical protein
MSTSAWSDFLDAFVFIFAQPIYYSLAIFLALLILAPILQFAQDYLSSRKKDD